MPRNTVTPDAVEAVRKALEQLASKPKSVTERSLIETHKDLIERALANGYDFKDIAGVTATVGASIPVARIRKYYQEAQGIPKRTRRKRGEETNSTPETNGNGTAPVSLTTEVVTPPASTPKNRKTKTAEKQEAVAVPPTEEVPEAEAPKPTRRRTTSSKTGTPRTSKTTRSSSKSTTTPSGRGTGRGTGRTTGRKKIS